MTSESNKELIKRYYSLFFKGGDVPFEEFFAPAYIDHNGYPNQVAGPNGVREGYLTWLKAFQIQKSALAEIIAEGNKVAVRTKVSGIHRGEYFSKTPSGKTLITEAISIFRLSQGKIQERWGLTDMREGKA